MSDRPRRAMRIAGGFEAANLHQAELAASVTPHTPATFPPPGAEHYRRLAESKRRDAASIVRHIRKSDASDHAKFALRQARELLAEAEQYQALAEGRTP